MIGVGVGGYEEVEKDGGNAGTLRDPRPGVSLWGGVMVVTATGHPPLKVGG